MVKVRSSTYFYKPPLPAYLVTKRNKTESISRCSVLNSNRITKKKGTEKPNPNFNYINTPFIHNNAITDTYPSSFGKTNP